MNGIFTGYVLCVEGGWSVDLLATGLSSLTGNSSTFRLEHCNCVVLFGTGLYVSMMMKPWSRCPSVRVQSEVSMYGCVYVRVRVVAECRENLEPVPCGCQKQIATKVHPTKSGYCPCPKVPVLHRAHALHRFTTFFSSTVSSRSWTILRRRDDDAYTRDQMIRLQINVNHPTQSL